MRSFGLTACTGSHCLPAGDEVRARQVGYALSDGFGDDHRQCGDYEEFSIRTRRDNARERGDSRNARRRGRTVISAPVPIDVLPAADLQQSGRTETAQMIQAVAPSINFPRASIADGTDHILTGNASRPAPDQTFDSYQRKAASRERARQLNGFVGRGAQAADLNAIPASMIDHIEILRRRRRRRNTARTRSPA